MRYRKQTATGDYSFGAGTAFLVDSPATVAQAVKTRMALHAGEWFLDNREGLDLDSILGNNTQSTRDLEVQQRILGTQGVRSIAQYSSKVSNRRFTVTAVIDTIYGLSPINVSIDL